MKKPLLFMFALLCQNFLFGQSVIKAEKNSILSSSKSSEGQSRSEIKGFPIRIINSFGFHWDASPQGRLCGSFSELGMQIW